MLDSSSSSNQGKTQYSRDFTKQLIRHFRIGFNKTRLAVVTFDSEPHLKWDLRDSINNDELKRRASEIKFENGTSARTGTVNESFPM